MTLDRPFDAQLSDPNSEEYSNLAPTIEMDLEEVFCDGTYPDCSVTITGLREGSVIADFAVTIKRMLNVDTTVVVETSEVKEFLDSMIMNSVPSIINGSSVTAGSFSQGGKSALSFLMARNMLFG